MKRPTIKKIGNTLVKDHPNLKIYLVQTCDGTLNLIGNNGYMELAYYHIAMEMMQELPDYELYLVLASKITEKRGFPEMNVIQDYELLVPRKSQEEIEAFYAQYDQNRKYIESEYTPSATDFLTCDEERVPMSELVLYAKKSSIGGNNFYEQKIYKHLETGNFYEIIGKYFIENLQQRLQAGECTFEQKLCSINTTQVATSKAELEREDFKMFESDYTSARRKSSITKLAVEL